jgi:iron(III) transport system permease protein
LTVIPVAVAILTALPVVLVLIDALRSGTDLSLPTGVGAMVVTTLELLVLVGVGTLVIGGGLAWLVTAYTFPLRNVFVWLLVLPMAMPAYIIGFIFLATFDISGPVQGWLRDIVGSGLWFPDVRSTGGAAVVMTLSLYPYVYLLARAGFVEQSSIAYDAARSLGANRSRTFYRIVLPLARPSLAAGLALVMMEALTDFATAQYFGVKTVSVGVYLVWKGSYDFASAAQISMLVLTFAVAVLAGERLMRGHARYHQRGGRGRGLVAQRLTGWRGAMATSACALVLLLGFAFPVARLVGWMLGGEPGAELIDPRFVEYLGNSATIAAIAAVLTVAAALLITHVNRMTGGRITSAAAQVTTFGYAVPGAVIGIGVLLVLARLDDLVRGLGISGGTGLLVTGSVVGILYAYVVRFLAPAYQSVDASMTKVSPSMTYSALSLGARPWRVLTRVHAPLARSGVLVALVLVSVDAIKELPIVLLLRPFGFTTVSVWVYQLAKENYWELAALPALVIVAAATIPVALLFRQVKAADEGRS